jgi:Holliday junction resolvase RusA-like endonuclease
MYKSKVKRAARSTRTKKQIILRMKMRIIALMKWMNRPKKGCKWRKKRMRMIMKKMD